MPERDSASTRAICSEPHYPKAKAGRPPVGIETMLYVHYLQQWFGLSDPAMEGALHDLPGRGSQGW